MVSRLTQQIQHVQYISFGVHTRCSGTASLTATRVHRKHFAAIPSAGMITREGREEIASVLESNRVRECLRNSPRRFVQPLLNGWHLQHLRARAGGQSGDTHGSPLPLDASTLGRALFR